MPSILIALLIVIIFYLTIRPYILPQYSAPAYFVGDIAAFVEHGKYYAVEILQVDLDRRVYVINNYEGEDYIREIPFFTCEEAFPVNIKDRL